LSPYNIYGNIILYLISRLGKQCRTRHREAYCEEKMFIKVAW